AGGFQGTLQAIELLAEIPERAADVGLVGAQDFRPLPGIGRSDARHIAEASGQQRSDRLARRPADDQANQRMRDLVRAMAASCARAVMTRVRAPAERQSAAAGATGERPSGTSTHIEPLKRSGRAEPMPVWWDPASGWAPTKKTLEPRRSFAISFRMAPLTLPESMRMVPGAR